MRRSLSAAGLVCLGIGIGFMLNRWQPLGVAQSPNQPGNPQEDRLLGNLYMITSGEYRACCLEIYRFGEERLAQKLRARPESVKKPAVVMDLDETVFDNAGFQTVLYRDRLVYRDDLWDPWEARFSPGSQIGPWCEGVCRSRGIGRRHRRLHFEPFDAFS